MAFCGKCGSAYAEGSAFCPQCGVPLGTGVPLSGAPAMPVATPAVSGGLQENVAGMLCYILGWITGIVFFLIDKRPFVRFHAAQSIVVFGFLFLLRIVFSFGFMGGGYFGVFSLWWMLSILLSLVTLAAWLILMILAFQGKRYEVPVAAGIAKSLMGNTPV
ncbi:MAG TPA: zinc-ribbon domain-containing protein [Acidobacteriaceae bacterium]|nr:zinc-ribbon domain-containing protein [Acidobacteriaceae bacterium]